MFRTIISCGGAERSVGRARRARLGDGMPGNSNLHDSSRNKQDEFYTNLQLIEDELKHYRAHFKGKRVLCNCDDPYESNFFKYFAMNFNALGLKSLTATCYAASPFAQMELDLFGEGLTQRRRDAECAEGNVKLLTRS